MTDKARHERLEWIDFTRGVGILLVIFGHEWRGLGASGIIVDYDIFKFIDSTIYLFHMPLFFLLSGFTAGLSLPRPDIWRYNIDRAVGITYVLIIWTYIFISIRLLSADYVNSPVSLADLLSPPLPPKDHLWFLWALVIIQLMSAPILFIASRHAKIGKRILLVSAIVAIPGAAAALAALDSNLHPWLGNALRHVPIFLFGAGMGASPSFRPTDRAALVGGGCFLLLQTAMHEDLFDSFAAWIAGHVAAVGFALAVAWVSGLASPMTRRALSWIGKMSLPLFLSHTIFSAGVRIFLVIMGVKDVGVHIVLGFIAGVAGPVVLLIMARRLRVTQALGLDGVPRFISPGAARMG